MPRVTIARHPLLQPDLQSELTQAYLDPGRRELSGTTLFWRLMKRLVDTSGAVYSQNLIADACRHILLEDPGIWITNILELARIYKGTMHTPATISVFVAGFQGISNIEEADRCRALIRRHFFRRADHSSTNVEAALSCFDNYCRCSIAKIALAENQRQSISRSLKQISRFVLEIEELSQKQPVQSGLLHKIPHLIPVLSVIVSMLPLSHMVSAISALESKLFVGEFILRKQIECEFTQSLYHSMFYTRTDVPKEMLGVIENFCFRRWNAS